MECMDPFRDKHYLCLAGGGPKGHVYTGALKAISMVASHFLKGLKGVVGTSVGSFFALLLACRLNVSKIADFVDKINFLDLVDINIDISQYGLDNGRLMRHFAEQTLQWLVGSTSMTFSQLRKKTGIQLVIVVTNVEKGQAEYHGWDEDTLDLPILDSLLASCSIPILFSPVTIGPHHYIDGGMTNNFAYSDVFPMQETIGMRFAGRGYKIDGFKSYLYRVVTLAIDQLDEQRYSVIPNIYQTHNIITFRVNDNPDLYYNTNVQDLKKTGFQTVCHFIEHQEQLFIKLLGTLAVHLSCIEATCLTAEHLCPTPSSDCTAGSQSPALGLESSTTPSSC